MNENKSFESMLESVGIWLFHEKVCSRAERFSLYALVIFTSIINLITIFG